MTLTSKRRKTNMYVNYGDASPLEYGAIWLDRDRDNAQAFAFVQLSIDDDSSDYIIQTGYIDTSETWLDKKSVKKSCNTPDNDIVRLALDCINYYGAYDFSDSYDQPSILHGKLPVAQYLTEYGIYLPVYAKAPDGRTFDLTKLTGLMKPDILKYLDNSMNPDDYLEAYLKEESDFFFKFRNVIRAEE